MAKRYWLIKSEPETFSIDDLKKCPKQTECWDGIRNYQARNHMRDDMKKGDIGLFYHSSCKVPGVVGLVEVVKESYPDHTSWDKKSDYFDPKSTKEAPRWFMVDIKFKEEFKTMVTLEDLKANGRLKEMKVVQRGQRLSIQPVTKGEFDEVMRMVKG